MIRPIGPLQNAWVYQHAARRPRSGPDLGALSEPLGALENRRLLREQQQDLQAQRPDPPEAPPYPDRPRPPS